MVIQNISTDNAHFEGAHIGLMALMDSLTLDRFLSEKESASWQMGFSVASVTGHIAVAGDIQFLNR